MMPWEKPPEPDYNEIPAFLKRNIEGASAVAIPFQFVTPELLNPVNSPPTKDQSVPLPWEPTT